MAGQLQDQVAFVTGAARGIGRAIAARFVSEGARVTLFDLPGSGVEQTAERLDGGAWAQGLTGDVSRPEEVGRAVRATLERFGGLDILVNNAGIGPMRPFLEMDIELYDKVMAVNARGSYVAALACAREMAPRQRGSIVQIASTCAFSAGASRNLSAYNMSKAAVRQMVASLAGELAPYRIRVNAVAPGSIDTEMTRACFPDADSLAACVRRIPLQSLGQPEDIAAACLYLCSAEGRYLTGQTLVVDGGWLVR
jgi:3-oxoacyl-[acyl-carrier protein] reductase